MPHSAWQKCLEKLREELSSQQLNTWLIPLQVDFKEGVYRLRAPNRFVMDWVRERFLNRIEELIRKFSETITPSPTVVLEVSSEEAETISPDRSFYDKKVNIGSVFSESPRQAHPIYKSSLNRLFSFDTFVEGKSNQLAKAAALQVSENPGIAYNPLFIYGGVGLGKTHLMHAVGNLILKKHSEHYPRVIYLHSERFVADMIKALQNNTISEFKRFYRGVNALLIDDIQFFAGKDRTQEEFFHTFNTLLEGDQQVILTCDRYPKEIGGLEERLKSRFGWGLTVSIEPPDLETRVAILKSKAVLSKRELSDEVAFFIAKRICSNVRELEGALKRVIAHANFTGQSIHIELVREALKDLFALQAKLVTIENIQKTVSEYFNIKISDLLSQRRNRSITRPRQLAMALAKELTSHSLPEIGEAFGGKDHTTVLHACRKVNELKRSESKVEENYKNLLRTLSS